MTAKTYSLKHNAVRAARKLGLTAQQAATVVRQDDAGAWYVEDGAAVALQADNAKAAYAAAKEGEAVPVESLGCRAEPGDLEAAEAALDAPAPAEELADIATFVPEIAETLAPAAGRGAGFARLQANADTEALRAAVVADQQAALEKARAPKAQPARSVSFNMGDVDAALNGGASLLEAFQTAIGKGVIDASPKAAARRKAAAAVRIEAVETKPGAAETRHERARKATGAPRVAKYAAEAIVASVIDNPKKVGSRAYAVFSLYRAGQTVEQFVAACVAAGIAEKDARANISWDARKGFITLG
jgi:hypothetical protein